MKTVISNHLYQLDTATMNLQHEAPYFEANGHRGLPDKQGEICKLKTEKLIRVLMVTPFPEAENEVVGGVAGVAYYLCQHLTM